MLWVVVSALSIATVYVLTEWETIPFHVVWVSLTLLCCFRLWSFRTTAVVLFVVTTVSGAALFHFVTSGGDALGRVSLRMVIGDMSVRGTRTGMDIAITSAKAFLNALNRYEMLKGAFLKPAAARGV